MKLLILKKYVYSIERKIYCIKLSEKLTIGTTGLYYHNNRWCWTTFIQKPRWISSHQRMINNFPYWKRRIQWKLVLYKLKRDNKLYKQCQGCGEGIAKYRIRDPNQGSGNKRFNCCEDCVNFYDIRLSAINIVKWKNKKPSCKRHFDV